MAIVTINRDPIGRFDIIRESVPNGAKRGIGPQGCTWCGQKPKTLYRYGTNSDGNNRNEFRKGEFCGKGCHDSYHSL